jgi:hypothetical protein
MSDSVRINGNQHSWASSSFKLDGQLKFGIKSISWENKRERSKVYGMGAWYGPRGRTSGKYTPGPLKITCFTSTAQDIRQQFAAASSSGASYGDAELPAVLQFVESNDTPVTVEFERCCLTSDPGKAEESPDATEVEMELDIMGVIVNGQVLYRKD